MKKGIIIYLAGFILAWGMTYRIASQKGRCVTYGDIVFISTFSFGSWASVIALSLAYIINSDTMNQPINNCK